MNVCVLATCACMYVANIHCYTSSLFKGRATFVKKLDSSYQMGPSILQFVEIKRMAFALFPVHRFVTNFRVRLSRKRNGC